MISATNRDLAKMVESQDFREDLYYRLNVFPIVIPPLRERVDDIEPLIERFLTQFNKKYGMHKTFSRETAAIMKRYSWPGNIRELRNIVERVMIVSTEDCITADHLPVEVNQVQVKSGNIILDNVVDLKAHLEEIELVYIEHAMDKYGNVRDAAKSLGMTASTLVRKRKRN